jgi:hypothetical protein
MKRQHQVIENDKRYGESSEAVEVRRVSPEH